MVNNNTLDNLYQKVMPAINAKYTNIKSLGYKFITKNDIWNYMINVLWTEKEYRVDELVSDILNTPNYLINDYLLGHKKNKLPNLFDDLL